MDIDKIIIKYRPELSSEQLWDFYIRNDICEVGHGKENAVKPLNFNPYIVAAFYEDKLVGIIRAMFDGLTADIMEFCLECELQGNDLKYNNGSVIERDKYGIAKQMADLLVSELRKLCNTGVVAYIIEGTEEQVYESIGLKQNTGHLVYIMDERPYI